MHDGSQGVLGFTVYHQDGSVETGSLTSPDWLQSGYAAYTTQGRVNVASFMFAQVNGGVPKLFTADITLNNVTSPVTRVAFAHVSGTRTAVFALSGALQAGGPFDPITVDGFNADVIVEATASRPQWLSGVTTASMETGLNNTLHTWFEQGYEPGNPPAGLPPAGSVLTHLAAPDHTYAMPSTYEANNAILLDRDSPAANLLLITPTTVRTLSFLTASANGPVTNRCIAHYLDGTSETNAFVSPDWMDQSSPTWSAGGRVNLNNRMLDRPAANGPSLFGVDVSPANTASPLTNVTVMLLNPSPNAHTVIFALSGQVGNDPVRAAVLTIRQDAAGTLLIESTEPGALESASELSGSTTVWTGDGPIEHSRTIQPSGSARFWRVRQR